VTRIYLLSLALLAVLTAEAQVPVRWIAQTARPVPQAIDVWQGETLELAPILLAYGTPMAWDSNTTVRLYWQTNGMGSAWWSVAGSTGGAPGQVQATWHPTNDVGAATYTFYLGASRPGGTLYRAFGTLRMRAAPGFVPTVLPPPPSVAAAIWSLTDGRYDPAGTAQGVSNGVAAALQVERETRAAGDVAAATNLQAAVDAEATARLLGDAANAEALAASGSVWRAEWRAPGDAARLVEVDATNWVEVVAGTATLYRVVIGVDTNAVVLTVTDAIWSEQGRSIPVGVYVLQGGWSDYERRLWLVSDLPAAWSWGGGWGDPAGSLDRKSVG
jgi:hypothetical protein